MSCKNLKHKEWIKWNDMVAGHRMRSPLALANSGNCGRRAPSASIAHSNFSHSCSKRLKKKDSLPGSLLLRFQEFDPWRQFPEA